MIPKMSRMALAVSLMAVLSVSFLSSPAQAGKRTSQLRLVGKTGQSVFIPERHYRVSESTVIIDQRGQEIDLAALPIPCQAEVTYMLRRDADPLALRIRVEDTFLNSRTNWHPEE